MYNNIGELNLKVIKNYEANSDLFINNHILFKNFVFNGFQVSNNNLKEI